MRSDLINLMLRSKLPSFVKLKPEEQLCVSFADQLRYLTLEGRLNAIWAHCPSEGKRSITTALIMRAMGMHVGIGDYFFCWKNGSGFMEFKAGKGKQTDGQKRFQEWCESEGVKYVVVRSAEDGIATLMLWGCLSE